jgi:hypothetical protein
MFSPYDFGNILSRFVVVTDRAELCFFMGLWSERNKRDYKIQRGAFLSWSSDKEQLKEKEAPMAPTPAHEKGRLYQIPITDFKPDPDLC